MFSLRHTSTSSNSMSRTSRLYWGCSVTIGASPRNCASSAAFCNCQPRKLLTPAYRILPARTESSKKPRVSSIGVSGIPGVRLVEVDGLDPEPAQTRFQRPGQVGAGQARIIGPIPHRKTSLGRDDELIPDPPPGRQPATNNLLRQTPGVHVGGVDEVPPALDEPVELSVRHLLAALVAERHRAQALRGHHRAGAAQGAVLHRSASLDEIHSKSDRLGLSCPTEVIHSTVESRKKRVPRDSNPMSIGGSRLSTGLPPADPAPPAPRRPSAPRPPASYRWRRTVR